jgi:thiol-disulfide isomerase/thioredoxin
MRSYIVASISLFPYILLTTSALAASEVRVIAFGSPACPPCLPHKRAFTEAASRHPDISFEYLEVEQANPSVVVKLGVKAVPVTFVTLDDSIIKSRLGELSVDEIEALLQLGRIAAGKQSH